MGIQKLTGSQGILGGAIVAADGVNFGGMKLRVKKLKILGSALTGTTSLTDSGWDVPYESIIEDVFLDIRTVASSGVLSVGLAGDVDGLLASVDVSDITFTPGNTNYYGELLKSRSTTFECRVPYFTKASTTRSVTYTRAATTFGTDFVGNLFIKYWLPST